MFPFGADISSFFVALITIILLEYRYCAHLVDSWALYRCQIDFGELFMQLASRAPAGISFGTNISLKRVQRVLQS